MKKRKKPTPKHRRFTRVERRELDALVQKILAGDGERLERNLMRTVYGKPGLTDVDPLPLLPLIRRK